MNPLSEADALEVWLALDLLRHAAGEERRRLLVTARDLVGRLRREGKLPEPLDKEPRAKR